MNSKLKIQKKWHMFLEAIDPIFLRILFVKDNSTKYILK